MVRACAKRSLPDAVAVSRRLVVILSLRTSGEPLENVMASTKQRLCALELALKHDALVALRRALDPVARIVRIGIRRRQQMANFKLAGRRTPKRVLHEIDALTNHEFMRHDDFLPLSFCGIALETFSHGLVSGPAERSREKQNPFRLISS
jgi:hypothetical protein